MSSFSRPATQTVVAPGDMVRFYGSAAVAVPPAFSTWEMNGITLTDGDRSDRVSILPNGALHIKNVSSVDGGKYTLKLSNDFRTRRFDADLQIGPGWYQQALNYYRVKRLNLMMKYRMREY